METFGVPRGDMIKDEDVRFSLPVRFGLYLLGGSVQPKDALVQYLGEKMKGHNVSDKSSSRG